MPGKRKLSDEFKWTDVINEYTIPSTHEEHEDPPSDLDYYTPYIRCTYVNPTTGTECHRHTRTNNQYCASHLKKVLGLRVGPSMIPNAGLGLFATRQFPPKKKIVEYTGRIISVKEANKLPNSNAYLAQLGQRVIDGEDPLQSSVARYANDPRKSGMKANVKFTANYAKKTMWLESVKVIKAGDEILLPYGDDYWKESESNSSRKKKKTK